MLKHLFSLAAVLLATGGIAGIAAQTPPEPEVPRISVADAKKAINAGKAVLVDVRSAMNYKQEHAKGAISLPTHEVAARGSELPKDKQIITYCT